MPATAVEQEQFLFSRAGAQEIAVPDRSVLAGSRPPIRGLAVREISLKRDYDHSLLGRLFKRRRENELFFITSAFDMSGAPPQVYPEKAEDAASAWIPLGPGQTHRFSLGLGMPLWGPKEVTGGVAIAVIVAESDKPIRSVGAHISKAAEAMKSDSSIVDFLAKVITQPASIPADMVFGVIGKVAAAAGAILEKNGNDHVGLFRGIFPADGSWDGMLEESQAGATIKLGEIKQD